MSNASTPLFWAAVGLGIVAGVALLAFLVLLLRRLLKLGRAVAAGAEELRDALAGMQAEMQDTGNGVKRLADRTSPPPEQGNPGGPPTERPV